jgi:hypothetical protein
MTKMHPRVTNIMAVATGGSNQLIESQEERKRILVQEDIGFI